MVLCSHFKHLDSDHHCYKRETKINYAIINETMLQAIISNLVPIFSLHAYTLTIFPILPYHPFDFFSFKIFSVTLIKYLLIFFFPPKHNRQGSLR